MQIAFTALAIAIVLFLCLFLGFREGIRLAVNLMKGKEPEPLKIPVKAVQSIVSDIRSARVENEADKARIAAERKLQQGISNLMNYSGDIPDEE